MDYTKKIEALEATRKKLEEQLETKGISEQKELLIRQQIITVGQEITALYNSQAGATSAAAQLTAQSATAVPPIPVYLVGSAPGAASSARSQGSTPSDESSRHKCRICNKMSDGCTRLSTVPVRNADDPSLFLHTCQCIVCASCRDELLPGAQCVCGHVFTWARNVS